MLLVWTALAPPPVPGVASRDVPGQNTQWTSGDLDGILGAKLSRAT